MIACQTVNYRTLHTTIRSYRIGGTETTAAAQIPRRVPELAGLG